MTLFSRLSVLLTVLLLFGCSATPRHSGGQAPQAQATSYAIDLNNQPLVREKLMAQYVHWKGTPYQFGGTSKQGIDCSALVQQTYRFHFGYRIPRTTRTQMQVGQTVNKNQLAPGDIVFFKVGWRTFHNGVYVGKGKFLHASTSRGVTLSRLSNPYWQKHFLTAKRIR